MAKRKIVAELYSYGTYTRWDAQSRKLPKLTNVTTLVDIVPGIEFGYVLKIKGAKGKLLNYNIEHPAIYDGNGHLMQSFMGECFVNSNDYEFFLGDTVWEPYGQMQGQWTLTTSCDGRVLAEKTFRLRLP
jgi:hypothetical protein